MIFTHQIEGASLTGCKRITLSDLLPRESFLTECRRDNKMFSVKNLSFGKTQILPIPKHPVRDASLGRTQISLTIPQHPVRDVSLGRTQISPTIPKHPIRDASIGTIPVSNLFSFHEKSRRDGTLLTVDFNLRSVDTECFCQVPQGRHLGEKIVSSLRDFEAILVSLLRRLKPTVNKMLSLRDIPPQTQLQKNVCSSLSHRDIILVENIFVHKLRRAVRYAIPSLHIMSLTGHKITSGIQYIYQYFVPNGTVDNISELSCN